MNALLKIATRNVRSHWRHSLAALLSITAAYYSVNIFEGYLRDLGHVYETSYRERSMLGDLIIMDRESESAVGRGDPVAHSLDRAMQETVSAFITRHRDQIPASVRFLDLQGTITNGSSSAIFISRSFDLLEGEKMRGELWRWNTLYGEPLDPKVESGRVALGQLLGHLLECDPNPKVHAIAMNGGYEPKNRPFVCKSNSFQVAVATDSGQLNAMDFEVTGLVDVGYRDMDRRFVWMSLVDGQRLLNTDRISYQTLMLRSPSDERSIIQAFKAEVGAKYPQLQMIRWQDHPRFGEIYVRSMELLSIFRNFVVTVIIVISSLAVFNTMTKSLSERTREIGTMQSLGFRKNHIRFLFGAESVLLACVGIAIGAGLTLFAEFAINRAGIMYKAGFLSEPVPFKIDLGWQVAALSGVSLAALTLFATLVACQKALRKKIIECLHHV
jgi:putative ABC transport system permease protein